MGNCQTVETAPVNTAPRSEIILSIDKNVKFACSECFAAFQLADVRAQPLAQCHHWQVTCLLKPNQHVADGFLNPIITVYREPHIQVGCLHCKHTWNLKRVGDQYRNIFPKSATFDNTPSAPCSCGFNWIIGPEAHIYYLRKRYGIPKQFCYYCDGSGQESFPKFDKCSNCNGTGGQSKKKCHKCKGEGTVVVGQTYERCKQCRPLVRIPTIPVPNTQST